MAYILEEDTTLHFTGGPLKPKGWCIHWWGDPAQKPTFDGIKRVLVNRSAAKSASINFMCEAGRVACLVSPFTIAWGQGDGATGWGNNNLVSVEMNPRCTAGDRETLAELIADQNIINGIPIVLYPHNKFNATQCPGTYERYFPEIIARAKQIVLEKTTGVKAQGSEEEVSAEDIAKAVLDTRVDRGAGMGGTLSLREMIMWYDPNLVAAPLNNWSYRNPGVDDPRDVYQIIRDTERQLLVQNELITALAVKQGVVIDYDAIAKAILDEEAKRLAE